MNIIVNGENVSVKRNKTTVYDLLNINNISGDKVVIELNGEILNQKEYTNIMLNENDKLEILKFMGGG